MDLKNLKRSRASIKAKLTIFRTFLDTLLPSKDLNNLQSQELVIRHDKLQDLYKDFDTIQNNIENITEIPDEEYEERASFESSYFGVMAAAQNLLGRHAAAAGTASAGNDCGSANPICATRKLHSRIPRATAGAEGRCQA
ncbi:hypothetical protein ACJJTC_015793 [Scirpophaga incertulas]